MRTSIALIAAFLTFSTVSFGQAHTAGDVFATGGIGFGHYGYHTGAFRSSIGLPVVANIDIGIVDYVSLGPYVGALFKDNSSALGFGGRGSFHFWQMISDLTGANLRAEEFDMYVSLYSGGEVSGFYTDRFRIGGTYGARWMWMDNIAVTVEFGGPMSYFMAGMSFKLLD